MKDACVIKKDLCGTLSDLSFFSDPEPNQICVNTWAILLNFVPRDKQIIFRLLRFS